MPEDPVFEISFEALSKLCPEATRFAPSNAPDTTFKLVCKFADNTITDVQIWWGDFYVWSEGPLGGYWMRVPHD